MLDVGDCRCAEPPNLRSGSLAAVGHRSPPWQPYYGPGDRVGTAGSGFGHFGGGEHGGIGLAEGRTMYLWQNGGVGHADDEDDVGGLNDIFGVLGQGISTAGDVLVSKEQRKAIQAGGDANSVIAMRRGGSPLAGSASTFSGKLPSGALLVAVAIGAVLLLRH